MTETEIDQLAKTLGRRLRGSVIRALAPEAFLSQGEVYALLGVSKTTFWRWCQDGTFTVQPVAPGGNGSRSLYRKSDVMAFIAQTEIRAER